MNLHYNRISMAVAARWALVSVVDCLYRCRKASSAAAMPVRLLPSMNA